MIPSPIHKVLSSMQRNQVQCLLMGGQACVLYGAAEFSRDADFAILADAANLSRLQAALAELQAERIAVPQFEPHSLDLGLAVHFRCRHPDAAGMWIDVMSKMRGVDEFPALWDRRTTVQMPDGLSIEVLSLPDLVQAKKTQRDKDWPMIARLLEANYFQHRDQPTPEQIPFWFRELRTPSLLCELAARFPDECDRRSADRRLLQFARDGDEAMLKSALDAEQQQEQESDRRYWAPLRAELERLRHTRGGQ